MGQGFAVALHQVCSMRLVYLSLLRIHKMKYENLAVELALNREKLLSIKEKLNKNRLTAPLFDATLFTRHLEAAYEAMYQRYQVGLPPDHIEIKPIGSPQ